jgi:hypothetical protein
MESFGIIVVKYFRCGNGIQFIMVNNTVNVVTNVMEQSPARRGDGRPAGQEAPLLLQNRKAYYVVHRNQSLGPVLSQVNPVNTSHFCKIHCNIVLFPPRRPGFDPRSCHVEFVVDKVALGQVFSEYFGFPCQS